LDTITHNWEAHRVILWFDAGFIDFQYDDYGAADSQAHKREPAWKYDCQEWALWWWNFHWRTLGFQFVNQTFPGGIGKHLHIGIPYWLVLLMTGILPLRWLKGRQRQRQQIWRRSHGLCEKCGYDLRAHQPGQKCPECGTTIPDKGVVPHA
jgi:hypothetical protein